MFKINGILFKILLPLFFIGLLSCKKEIETLFLTYPTVKIISANSIALTTYELIIDIDLGNKEKIDGAEIIFDDITVSSESDIIQDITLTTDQKQRDTVVLNLNRLNHDYLVKVRLKSDPIFFYSNEKIIRSSKCTFKISLIEDDMYSDMENGISSFHNKTDTAISIIIDFSIPFKEKTIEVKLNDSISIRHNISFKNYYYTSTGLSTGGGAYFPNNLPPGIYDVSVYIDSVKFKADSKIQILEGEWSLLSSSFPGIKLRQYANFVIEDNLFLIEGDRIYQPKIPKVWQCDLNTGTWYSKKDFPVQRVEIFGFTLKYNGNGYIALSNSSDNDSTELWRYDHNQDTWSYVTNYPGNGRSVVCFAINDKLYAGGGSRSINNNIIFYNDFWSYSFLSNTWTHLGNSPISMYPSTHFSCVGEQKAFIYTLNRNLWQYDPSSDFWSLKSKFPGPSRQMTSLAYVNNKIYLIGGHFTDGLKDCWEYSIQNNEWKLNSFFPSYSNSGVVFSYKNQIIGGLGYESRGYMTIYEPNLYFLIPSN